VGEPNPFLSIAGGRPAAGYFLAPLILLYFALAETRLLQSFVFLPAKKTPVSAQPKSNQKEGDPGLPRHLAGGVPLLACK
jgi:hypothetical protein